MPESTSGIPDGYTGKTISVVQCAIHGAHVHLGMLMTPVAAWDASVELAAASQDPNAMIGGSVPILVDEMTPEACETFARDLQEAAARARAAMSGGSN